MKVIFGFIGLLLIVWLLSVCAFFNEAENKTKVLKSKLGKEYILDKDTLTIVDYNSFKDVVILSNGKEVNSTLVK